MRRIIAWIGIVAAATAFVLLSMVLILKVDIIIPILLFAFAFIMMFIAKRIPDSSGATEHTIDADLGGNNRPGDNNN